ncbi:MAG: hypothetical protein ACKOI0_06810, partial [Actinomycetota bacterium]
MGEGTTVRLEVADGVGVIRLARPPANVLGTPEAEGLVAAAGEAFDAAMVLARGFAVGPTRALAAAKGALRGSQPDLARGLL